MDSNILSALIGSITSFFAVWIDGVVKNKRNKKEEFELFRKIFIDIFGGCESELSKMVNLLKVYSVSFYDSFL